MKEIFASYTATDLLAIGVGIALLTFGRRLYWLALGGVGFFLGLWLASQVLDLRVTGLALGIGFLVGILGACLAVAVQKLAVGLGGFFIGGALAYWLASWLALSLSWQPGFLPAAAAILGAILGTVFAAVLFESSLLALTCLLGALLVVHASHVSAPQEGWLFLILLCTGAVVQSRRRRRRTTPTG